MKRNNRSRYYYIIVAIIIIITFILGIIYFNITKEYTITNYNLDRFISNINNYKPTNILYSIILYPASIVLSYILIGPILLSSYILYNFFSAGYITALMYNFYGIKSVLFIIIYNLIYTLIPSVILTIQTLYNIKLSKEIIKRILKRSQNLLLLQKYTYRSIILLIIYIIISILIYFLGSKLLSLIAFFN